MPRSPISCRAGSSSRSAGLGQSSGCPLDCGSDRRQTRAGRRRRAVRTGSCSRAVSVVANAALQGRRKPTDMHQSVPTSMLPDAASAPTGPNAQPPWVGRGTAWLVYDAAPWLLSLLLAGRAGRRPPGRARRGAQRRGGSGMGPVSHPRARIRLPDHRTYWAGTDPAPGGFAGAWTAAGRTTTPATGPPVPRNHASPGSRRDGLKGDIAGV